MKCLIELHELRATLTVISDDFHIWDIWPVQRLHTVKAGQLVILTGPKLILDAQTLFEPQPSWIVANMFIADPYRGHGYMRQLLTELLEDYGAFTSDFKAAWSPDAIHMWEAMGARRWNTDRCPKGYVYVLCSTIPATSLETPAK